MRADPFLLREVRIDVSQEDAGLRVLSTVTRRTGQREAVRTHDHTPAYPLLAALHPAAIGDDEKNAVRASEGLCLDHF